MNYRRFMILLVAMLALPLMGAVQAMAAGGPVDKPRERTNELPDCISLVRIGDGPELTVDLLAQSGASVALVNVVEVGPAQWTTLDGKRPTGVQELRESSAGIVRPVEMELEMPLIGEPSKGTIHGYVLGGQVGCDTLVVENPIDPRAGSYVAVIVSDGDPISANEAPIAYLWPVSNGVVASPELGSIGVDALSNDLSEAGR